MNPSWSLPEKLKFGTELFKRKAYISLDMSNTRASKTCLQFQLLQCKFINTVALKTLWFQSWTLLLITINLFSLPESQPSKAQCSFSTKPIIWSCIPYIQVNWHTKEPSTSHPSSQELFWLLETIQTQSVTLFSLWLLAIFMSGHGLLNFRISLKFTSTPFKPSQASKISEYYLSMWFWIPKTSFMPFEEDWLIIQLHITHS